MAGLVYAGTKVGVGELIASNSDTGAAVQGFVPYFRAVGANGVAAASGTAADPVIVRSPTFSTATSTPLAGTASASATIGPFTPQLARSIWLTLSGTWAGTVQVMRSVDAGTTKLPLTITGSAYASFTANANEQVIEESEAAATYYLAFTWTSGTLTYRMAQ